MPIEGWLTAREAADKLHVALDTMRRYIREGKFARTRVGKQYLIPESEIEQFLRSGLETGPRPVVPRKEAPASKEKPAARKRS